MKTITIQIGNSDDKLSQKKWAEYVREVDMYVESFCQAVHFFGTSPSDEDWQNACWVAEVRPDNSPVLKRLVANCGKEYGQDSIAWTEGTTEFI